MGTQFFFPSVLLGLKGEKREDLEPLDKGRLSLGDEGDAFRAKRGKNSKLSTSALPLS